LIEIVKFHQIFTGASDIRNFALQTTTDPIWMGIGLDNHNCNIITFTA